MASDPGHFSPDYATARRRFLAAAEGRGARVAARTLPVRASRGEELSVDTAYLGPEAPARVLAVSSGVHGVEGFAGSAVQLQLLAEQLDGLSLPGDTGLLLVHAINPFGFAELRRVNESNVDLNRNFLEHPAQHVANDGYEELLAVINPERLDEESEQRCRETLLAWARTHGFPALQSALTRGQYRHPHGVQFGGERPEASNAHLRDVVARESRGARRIAWIDVHTGLGPYGVPEMITELPPDDPGYLRARAWFGGAVKSTISGESVSSAVHGPMERGLAESLPDGTELTVAAAEFGTYEPTRVFWAMRADNWLQHHGDPDSEQGRAIKAELLEVFRPADPAWMAKVLEGGARLLAQARAGLAASG